MSADGPKSDYEIRRDALEQTAQLVQGARGATWSMETVQHTARVCEYYLRTGRELSNAQQTELASRDQTVLEFIQSKGG